MNHFCTISTFSHLYKVKALAESLKNQHRDFLLHVLVTDNSKKADTDTCKFYSLEDLKTDSTASNIISKYSKSADKLRWSLKPAFIRLLLASATEKVVYLDNDQFFYADYQFLFNLLNENSFLLTPHHYQHTPQKEQNWFEANFKVGLYNAGFIGANKKAIDTLQWWAECCEYRCEKNSFRGLFDDQKYLDLIPVINETALVLRHKGCNVASWNKENCKRQFVNGEVKIEGQFPVVFIHFNSFTIREIINSADSLLLPYYEKYEATLKRYKPDLKRTELFSKTPLLDKLKYFIWKLMTDLGL